MGSLRKAGTWSPRPVTGSSPLVFAAFAAGAACLAGWRRLRPPSEEAGAGVPARAGVG